jgi:hypothetical protein
MCRDSELFFALSKRAPLIREIAAPRENGWRESLKRALHTLGERFPGFALARLFVEGRRITGRGVPLLLRADVGWPVEVAGSVGRIAGCAMPSVGDCSTAAAALAARIR